MKRHFYNKKARGYTLIEMLLVVGIIGIILAFSANTMKNLATAEGVRAGMPVMKIKFEEARQLAKSTGRSVRVVIYSDAARGSESAENMDRFLRYVAIAHYVDASGDPVTDYTVDEDGKWDVDGRWVIQSPGIHLPSGCYYDKQASVNDKNGNVYAEYLVTSKPDAGWGGERGTCPVYFPNDSSPSACHFYEFNGAGFPTNPLAALKTRGGSSTPPRVVLSQGQLRRTSATVVELVPNGSGDRNYAGFAMSRHGEIIDYDDLDDVKDRD